MCDRWIGEHGFENFLADMGERPSATSIDRINNDGNYEPGNCRWADIATQNRNKRDSKLLGWDHSRIILLFLEGTLQRDIAATFDVSESRITQVLSRYLGPTAKRRLLQQLWREAS